MTIGDVGARFNLMNGDDETLLRFLCETMQPVVRPDSTEAERMCQLYNQYLQHDGFQIVEKTSLANTTTACAITVC